MKIKQTCCYITRNYNVLPAILVTPKEDGFIIAFKWLNLHYGVYLETNRRLHGYDCCPPYWWVEKNR